MGCNKGEYDRWRRIGMQGRGLDLRGLTKSQGICLHNSLMLRLERRHLLIFYLSLIETNKFTSRRTHSLPFLSKTFHPGAPF